MKKVFIPLLLLALSACAQIDPSITDQTVVYHDAPVRKSPLQVSVRPRGKQLRPLTALVRPFRIQQRTPDHAALADSFARIFHNAWLEERLFSVQEFPPGIRYQPLEYALSEARRKNSDLLIVGRVPYFYAGHTVDDTAITLQVDIYATDTGTLLWTMMQSARMEEKPPKDYIYFRQETRMSTSPVHDVIRAIAKDMAVPLKAWLPDPDARYAFANESSAMRASLAPTPPQGGSIMGEQELTPDNTASSMSAGRTGTQPKSGKTGREQKSAPESGGAGAPSGTMRPAGTGPDTGGLNLSVLFEFDKSTIKPESYPLLDELGKALQSPELKGKRIIIGGHTDSKGEAKYNLDLSQKRAESVKRYLADRWQIDPGSMDAVGYGKSRPLTEGRTQADQQKNRRVEVRLAE